MPFDIWGQLLETSFGQIDISLLDNLILVLHLKA
jgi:hypothetical protein